MPIAFNNSFILLALFFSMKKRNYKTNFQIDEKALLRCVEEVDLNKSNNMQKHLINKENGCNLKLEDGTKCKRSLAAKLVEILISSPSSSKDKL